MLSMIVCLLALLVMPVRAQLLGTLTDTPQHVFAFGAGFDPSTHEGSGFMGYGEKIPAGNSTYSYTRAEFIPSFTTVTNPTALGSSNNLTTTETTTSRVFSVRPVLTTGIKQIVYQEGRVTLAVDGSVGAGLPTFGTSSFNTAFSGGVDLIWRLNSTLHAEPGGTNNYLAFGPSLVQLTGAQGGTTVAVRFAWLHSANPTAAAMAKAQAKRKQ